MKLNTNQALVDRYLSLLPTTIQSQTITVLPKIIADQKDVDNLATTVMGYVPELWNGNWESLGRYPSQSEADFALCGLLVREAMYKGIPDNAISDAVCRAFAQSGLHRPEKEGKIAKYAVPKLFTSQLQIRAEFIETLAKNDDGPQEDGGTIPRLNLMPAMIGQDSMTRKNSVSADITAIVEMVNKKFCWDENIKEIYDQEKGVHIRREKLVNHYSNEDVVIGYDRNGSPKKKTADKVWMESKDRQSITGLALRPSEGQFTHDGKFNTWRGYSVAPEKGCVDIFYKVFNHLHPNPDDRVFILNWVARLIQNPETKFNVALVVHGVMEGTGKNSIYETIGDLFHPQHFAVIGCGDIADRFTEWKLDKVLIIGDEVSAPNDRTAANKIKMNITARENIIDNKYGPKLRQQNLIKYIFLSNHDEPVFISETDRRFYIAETTYERLPKALADEFYAWKKTGGLSHLLDFFLSYDCSGFDPTAPAPMTEAKKDVIDAVKTSLELAVEDIIPYFLSQGRELVRVQDIKCRIECHGSTDKAIGNALKRAGAVKLKKKAILSSEKTANVYSLRNHANYKKLTGKQLGYIFDEAISLDEFYSISI